jgi:TRAP-type uncharacterized transport system substrate-binding protein
MLLVAGSKIETDVGYKMVQSIYKNAQVLGLLAPELFLTSKAEIVSKISIPLHTGLEKFLQK